ncbi:MAG: fucose isomerase, partial [Spirochaetia bacterium]
LGIVAVSRDCFPIDLSKQRKKRVLDACRRKNVAVHDIPTMIESEKDVEKALEEARAAGVNALVVYLGNFGPEGPTTLLVQKFSGPVMYAAAAEDSGSDLIGGRGDAYCGLLNTSYNTGLRKLRPYVPHYPVGIAEEITGMIQEFIPIARVIISLRNLKIFSFGPRPQDFLACNAPIKPLYDLGIEIMENSELDLLDAYRQTEKDKRIEAVAADMAEELGQGNNYPDLLKKLARYEIALGDFLQQNLGASAYGVFANKCWPAFEKYFEFVPCYVNSRLAERLIPVACETDIYGALSEYMATAATEKPATILDINNTVPADLYKKERKAIGDYKQTDLFMGFHCGNTPSSCLASREMKYQLIMHRLMEPGKEPDITRGTLEGRFKSGKATIFRLQGTADTRLAAYIAHAEILDMDPQSFGGIGVMAVREMARFYRYVLIEKRFPHHTGVAFAEAGRTLAGALAMLGVDDVSYNLPESRLYPGEYPFN